MIHKTGNVWGICPSYIDKWQSKNRVRSTLQVLLFASLFFLFSAIPLYAQDVGITKEGKSAARGDSFARPGDRINYTLYIADADLALGVVVTDSLPAQVTLSGSPIGNGVTISQTSAAPNFSWVLTDVTPGGVTIQFSVIVTDNLTAGTLITNTAGIYAIGDATPADNFATSTITVLNSPPIADDETITVTEDSSNNSIAVLTGDSDRNGDLLSITAVGATNRGGVVTISGSQLSYTPTANFFGSETFTYTVNDGHGGSDIGAVTVQVTSVNDAPIANPDSSTLAEDSSNNLLSVLGNDSDIENDSLTISAVGAVSHGTLVNLGSQLRYTPTANYFGSEVFTYTVSDGNGGSDTTSVTLTVTSVNDAPLANPDSSTFAEDSSNNLLSVLGNDSDIENDTLTITAIGTVSHGTLANLGSQLRYTPTANYFGSEVFTYTVSDGNGGSDTTSVTLTITSVNDVPVANPDTATLAEDSSNNLLSVLGNDSDIENDTLNITAVGAVSHGTLANLGSQLRYTPTANYFGSEVFTYTVSDGNGGSDTASVTLTITSVNDAPIANPDSSTLAEDSSNNLLSVLGNDSDIENDTLNITAVGAVSHGTLANLGTQLRYTPTANYFGSEVFTYTVSDGNGGNDTTSVTLTVTSINDAPLANPDSSTLAEDSSNNLLSVLDNDSDIENDSLTITAIGAVSHGTLVNLGSQLRYTPTANYFGSEVFTYTVSDGNGGSDTTSVTLTITSVNDAPLANPDTATLTEDSSNNLLNVLGNDSDIENDSLTISAVGTVSHGTLVNLGSQLRYTPTANYFGSEVFTYTVNDGNGGNDTTSVTLTVTSVNDAPLANPDSSTLAEDSSNNLLSVLGNDSDIENDTLSITAVGVVSHGTLANLGSQLRYTPTANYFGSEVFTYTVNDGNGGNDTTSVTLTITSINDAPLANPDSSTLTEDSSNNMLSVLGNDSDIENDSLSISAVGAVSHGTLTQPGIAVTLHAHRQLLWQ